MSQVIFSKCGWCDHSVAWLPNYTVDDAIDEDSLTCQDMADIEDGKHVCFDEGRHKRHVCREQKEG